MSTNPYEVKWSTVERRYGGAAHIAKVGKITVGECQYNLNRSRNDADSSMFTWSVNLPQLNAQAKGGVAASIEDCKKRIEKSVQLWFAAALN